MHDLIYVAFVIAIYGPKRLWQSSASIHPLRLFNYVLSCFIVIYLWGQLAYLTNVYPGDPVKELAPPLAQRLEYALFIPIFEEFVFRLTLFQVVRSKLGFLPAALISSVAFGFEHIGYADHMEIMVTAVAGMVWAWCYEKTGTILAPILLHILLNTWSQVYVFL